jgi:gas vesicle protein
MRRLMFFFIGGLVGAILGALAAFLLAPESGNAIRQDARDKFDALMDEAKLAAETRRRELESQLAEMTAVKK